MSGRLHSSRSQHTSSRPGYFAGLLVEQCFCNFHGSDFFAKETLLLRAGRALLADHRILILGLASDLVTLGYDLRRLSHRHVDSGIFLFDSGAGIVIADDEADAFHAAADRRVRAFIHDLMGHHRNRLQTGRAEPVHRNRRDRDRQTRQQRRHSRDIVALHSVRLAAAENDVFDFFRIQLRCFA